MPPLQDKCCVCSAVPEPEGRNDSSSSQLQPQPQAKEGHSLSYTPGPVLACPPGPPLRRLATEDSEEDPLSVTITHPLRLETMSQKRDSWLRPED